MRKGDHIRLEAPAEDELDRIPFVHADRGDHQHTGQRRQRDACHEGREQEHREQQSHRVDDADKTGLPARFDAHAGAGDRGRGRDSAKEGDDHIANALGDQLLVGLQADAGHVGSRPRRTTGIPPHPGP